MEEAKSRYMMVGVFTIPVARKSRELVPLVPGLGEILAKEKVAVEEGDLEGPLLPEVEEGGDDIPGHVDGDPGDMEKWEEMVEPEEVEVRNYTQRPIHWAGTGSPMDVRNGSEGCHGPAEGPEAQ